MKTSLPNLQILRFLAAAMVLLSHVQHEAEKMIFPHTSYEPWEVIFLAGGVDIFFVISGFIMYLTASAEFGREGATRDFLLRRLIRIAPPYWAFTVAMIAATYLFASHISHPLLDASNVISSFLFFPHDNAYGKPYPVLILGWTLNYEFFFYVIFGMALMLPRKSGLTLIFSVIGVLAVAGIGKAFQGQPWQFWSNPITLEFLFGICLAAVYLKGVRLSGPTCFLLLAGGFVAMVIFKQMGIVGGDWTWRFLWMGLPAVVICAGGVLRHQGAEGGALRKFLVFLGDASYSLYLSHPFSLNLIALLWKKFGLSAPYLYVACSCIFSMAVGALVHVWMERPLMRYLNKKIMSPLYAKHFAPERT